MPARCARPWLLVVAACGAQAQESWMGDNWEALRSRHLLDLSLPGSHNSGNTHELNADLLCQSDYRYSEFLAAAKPGDPKVTEAEFNKAFIPWNINHDHSILQQLNRGIRWFHLKVCDFNAAGSDMDLAKVYHQHRGYTAQSLEQIIVVMRRFLLSHPQETIVLGFNNLHHNSSASLPAASVSALAAAVLAAFARDGLQPISGTDLVHLTMADLADRHRRFAVFFKTASLNVAENDSPDALPEGALSSSEWLTETWDNVMGSGDLLGSEHWLTKELETEGVGRGRFFSMQANPNNAESKMYALIRSGQTPHSLKEWIAPFLEDVPAVINNAYAKSPTIQINAISTDFAELSKPYELAMKLNKLPLRPAGEKPMDASNGACLNKAIASGRFEDSAVDGAKYQIRSAYVMQRHCDRWIYGHALIGNSCWPKQVASSNSSLMVAECSEVPLSHGGKLTTAWNEFPQESDLYSAPARGTCQIHGRTPQATSQGRLHARKWGDMLKAHYVPRLVPMACPEGTVALRSDKVHKNELTVQTEYEAMCGRTPDLVEFPREATLVGFEPGLTKGTPWYIQKEQCGGSDLKDMLDEAEAAMKNSSWWRSDMKAVTTDVAKAAGKPLPPSDESAELLDNIMDCVVVHGCTGLADTPKEFVDDAGRPDLGGLYGRLNRAETATRLWAMRYWRKRSPQLYRKFASMYYGYFFAALGDQLRAAAQGNPRAPKLTISVMSDSNISPLLMFYGLDDQAMERPPYLSAFIHEVYEHVATRDLLVRVLFNGEVLRVCSGASSFPLCPMDEWMALIGQFVPDRKVCPALYRGYDFLTDAGYELLSDPAAPPSLYANPGLDTYRGYSGSTVAKDITSSFPAANLGACMGFATLVGFAALGLLYCGTRRPGLWEASVLTSDDDTEQQNRD